MLVARISANGGIGLAVLTGVHVLPGIKYAPLHPYRLMLSGPSGDGLYIDCAFLSSPNGAKTDTCLVSYEFLDVPNKLLLQQAALLRGE